MPRSKSNGQVSQVRKEPQQRSKVLTSPLSIRPATSKDVVAPRGPRGSKGSKYDVLADALLAGPQVITTDKGIAGLRSGVAAWGKKHGLKLSIKALVEPNSILVSLREKA